MPTVVPLLAADPRRIGPYRLTGVLGEGRGARPGAAGATGPLAAVVYLGRAGDGAAVTLTLLQPLAAGDTAARDRFVAEARAAREVAPFCVARMFDAGLYGDLPYVVGEYVPGPSLTESVFAHGPAAGDVLRAAAIGAATGLAAIHQAGLVHGCFGPQALVLGPDGPRVVHSGVTPPYGLATPAADVRAWARTVLFAATGEIDRGFTDPRPQQLRHLTAPLRQVVAECLNADPAARPPAKVIVTRLLGHGQPPTGILAAGARAAASAGSTAHVRQRDERPARRATHGWRGRRSAAAGAVATMIAAAAAGTAVIVWPHGPSAPHSAPAVPSRGSQGRSRGGTAPARPSTTPTSATQRIPADLNGQWAGPVSQATPPLSFTAEVTLTAGAATGSVSYPSFNCTGILTLTSVSHSRLVFRQGIVSGQQTCGQGTVTLTPHGTTLGFSFSPAVPGGPPLSGTLSAQ